MKDRFKRDITYMRISLTDRCNFRCKYCMPEHGVENIGHENILKLEDIEKIVKAAVELGITKFRLTGGEPLVRKGVMGLVANISAIPGVSELTLTTNGALLGDMADKLKKAGLDRVNISIDTLRPDRFEDITRGGSLEKVLLGIAEAEKAGLGPIKLNVVMMKGFNDDELQDFVGLAMKNDYEVRFIELMPIGLVGREKINDKAYMSSHELISRLPGLEKIPQKEGQNIGVADLYYYPGAKGTIGFISPLSSCFCGTCNKIRLTADGKLKPCLHSDKEIDLKPVLRMDNKEALKEILSRSIWDKDERHHIGDSLPVCRDMNKIGG